MAIIYKTGYTEDSGGLLLQNVAGPVALEFDFYRPLSDSVADNTDSFTFVSGDIGGGSGGFYTLDASGNFTNTSNGSGLTELRINGVISNPVDLNTAGADTVRLQFTSVLGGSFTVFDYPDNPAGSNSFLFRGVEVSRINVTDDNGSRDLVIGLGTITDPSGIINISTYGDVSNFEDTTGGDTTKPVITLAAGTDTVTVGGTWTDAGATWTDNVDGSGVIASGVGTVDTNTVGTYTVTYDYTDAAGNVADTVTRTVNIVEATAASKVFLQIGQSNVVGWSAAGANDTNYTLGDYPVGASGRVRQIGVNDPTIRNATNPLDHWDEPVGSAGLWKTFAEKIPENQIWVAAGKGGSSFDYPANTDPQTWTKGAKGGYYDKSVELLGLALAENPANTIGAVILWLGESAATHSRTQQEMFDDLVALRNNYIADTAITEDTIWIVYGVRVNSAGLREKGQVIRDALQQFAATSPAIRYVDNMSYPMADTVHYTAAGYNQAGLDGYAAYIATTDTAKPVITLDKYTETITVGDSWTPPVATVTDNVNTGLTADRSGTIDHTTVGNGKTYTYNATDAAGNAADPVTYTLNVVAAADTEKPVLTLNGQATVTHTQGQAFTDLGASWADNVDGSGTVYADTALNVNLVGTQTLTYNYTDGAGNAADPVTRTVTVNAVITGDDPVIYRDIAVSGSLEQWIDNGTEIVHKGDTIKITPSATDNNKQPLTIGNLVVKVFGTQQTIAHGGHYIVNVPNDTMPKERIVVECNGPNGGKVVVATKTLRVQ